VAYRHPGRAQAAFEKYRLEVPPGRRDLQDIRDLRECTVKALVKYEKGVGHVELRDMTEPRVAPGQVKIAVHCCGICGTDLHVYHDRFRNYPPVILGHEFAGTVVETGPDVTRFQTGDRVTVLPASAVTCGTCRYCRQGQFMFCPQRRGMGHGVHGAFTRFALAREDQLYRVPDHLSLEVAAMSEPMAAAVHAVVEKAPVKFGDVILLSGPGPIGLMSLKLLVAEGFSVIVAGTTDDHVRLELARTMGAAAAVDVTRQDLLSVVHERTGGLGVDVAIECAGAGASVCNCLDALRPGGSLTQVGHFGQPIQLNYDHVAYKELHIRGSVGYTAATWDRVMRILEDRQVDLSDLVSHTLPLEAWREGFDLCERKQGLKVLLTCGGSAA
jgi:L-iditol 2-dehydrogenase